MRVKMGTIWLADHGTRGESLVSGLTTSSRRVIQLAPYLRAKYIKPFNRRNAVTRIGFTVTRIHDDLRTAEAYLLRQEHLLEAAADGGRVTFWCEEPAGRTTYYFLHNGQVEHHSGRYMGVTTYNTYALVGGLFSVGEG